MLPLEHRREMADLVLLFNSRIGSSDINHSRFIQPSSHNRRYKTRNSSSYNYEIMFAKHDYLKNLNILWEWLYFGINFLKIAKVSQRLIFSKLDGINFTLKYKLYYIWYILSNVLGVWCHLGHFSLVLSPVAIF